MIKKLNSIQNSCFIEIIIMGGGSSNDKKRLQVTKDDQLDFYTSVMDPNLGLVRIYTSKQYHLCYILKYEKTNQDTKIYNIFKNIQQNQSNQLLSLYGFNIERKTCCNKIYSENVCSYWEYYNFYFNEYLQKRRQQGLTFIDSQIWHIIQTCCEAYNVLRKYGLYYQINSETFVVTPQGKMKAFWCHLKSQNNHMKFFQYFDSNYKIIRFPYAPQQLQSMYQQQRTTKIDFDRCNSYRLGILLLQCLTLTDPLSNCYNPSMTAINYGAIRNLILSKVSPIYSNDITTLLRFLLRQDPKKRPTLSEIYKQYHSRFSPEFQLRVCGVRLADSVNVGNQNLLESSNMKKHDLSNDKTVKFRHSFKRN